MTSKLGPKANLVVCDEIDEKLTEVGSDVCAVVWLLVVRVA
jgi:hypothetical protein